MSAGSKSRSGPVRLAVAGSINMDLLVRTPSLPRPGQTVTGRELHESPGGKGANQAVAAARLGARVAMIGRVGDDGYGDRLRACLEREGIDATWVVRTPGCSSGVAVVCVDDDGENSITVIPGANGHLTRADVAAAEAAIASADVLLVQLEAPLDTVAAALEAARARGVLTVLDPAPAPATLPAELFEVDVLCPNESEAAALTGAPVEVEADAERAARALRERGARNAVVTLGSRGALLCDESGLCELTPAFEVPAVDATAAGDAFAAALGVGLAESGDIRLAVRQGCAAGALAATRAGAQAAMPDRSEMVRFLER